MRMRLHGGSASRWWPVLSVGSGPQAAFGRAKHGAASRPRTRARVELIRLTGEAGFSPFRAASLSPHPGPPLGTDVARWAPYRRSTHSPPSPFLATDPP